MMVGFVCYSLSLRERAAVRAVNQSMHLSFKGGH